MKQSIPFMNRYMTVTGDDRAITFCDLSDTDETDGIAQGELKKAVDQLKRYASGEAIRFDITLDPQGTSFQKKVWAAMREIPYGQTKTYGDLARAIGSPKAFRAVGGACNRNPLTIVQPCHRVVGSDGSLTGFFGGLDLKAQLLEFEKRPRR